MNNVDPELQDAMLEAQRFLSKARQAQKEDRPPSWSSPARAAAKRASLDLTRALARYRKG